MAQERYLVLERGVFRGGQPESHPGKRQSEEAVTEDRRVHMALSVTL